MRHLVTTFFAALALSACGPTMEPTAQDDVASSEQDIVGGTINRNDPNVFLLIMQQGMSGGICTATLIGRRTLLTAAHCVDDVGASYFASNAPTDGEIRSNNYWRIVDKRIHPGWSGNSGSFFGDIAVAKLEAAPPNVTPKPWNSASLSGMQGRTVRAVGYGTTGNDMGSGTKREVTLTLRALQQYNLFIGNFTDKGICQGDSGGPTFMTFSDGVERVIGVHSYTIGQECTNGADSRTDYYASTINTWLAEFEGATCVEDGQCKAGCTPPDIDCLCARDGTCSAQCPDLNKDPDCPMNCGADGICSTGVCPVADRDCVAEGQPCSNPNQCKGRQCITDAQHSTPYCSTRCASSADCGAEYECSLAATSPSVCWFKQRPVAAVGQACVMGATYCGAPVRGFPVECASLYSNQPPTCAVTCDADANCSGGFKCQQSTGSAKVCAPPPKPPLYLGYASWSSDVASSCASVGGLAPWLVLAAVRLRSRRRR